MTAGQLTAQHNNQVEARLNQQNTLAIAQENVKKLISSYKPVIAKLIAGTGQNVETFVAQLANSYRAVPDLWLCQPETVLGASLKAAQLGLAPNDNRNLCWILPYKGQASFQMGYGGIMALARRAVPGLKFDGRAVYPNDVFDLDFGRAQPLIHKPAVTQRLERGGDAYAWYVRATYPDGDELIEVLDRDKVEYHRSFSKQRDGMMWSKSYDAAALKSCVADMKRWLPTTPQMAAGFAADEEVVDVNDVEPIEASYSLDEPPAVNVAQ